MGKNLLSSNIGSRCPHNMAKIVSLVWGTPANFNGFRVLAALLQGTPVLDVSQIFRRWTEGATYIWQGDHHVGHWPTFLLDSGCDNCFSKRMLFLFFLCFGQSLGLNLYIWVIRNQNDVVFNSVGGICFCSFGRVCLCLLDGEVLHGHRDYEQVVLDVKRSAKRFPPGYYVLQSMTY